MCNFCEFTNIVARARRQKQAVTLMKPSYNDIGVTVFVHPPDVDVTKLEDIDIPGSPNCVKYFVAWFMELPEEHVG